MHSHQINENFSSDEFIAHKEDDHVDAIDVVNGDAENDVEQNASGDVDTEKVGEVISRTDAVDTEKLVGQAISDTVDGDDVDGDISATEISTIPSKSKSKLPVPKKNNQAVSSG